MIEPARITASQAKSASEEELTLWANRYHVGSGAHTVITAEIERRAENKRNTKRVVVAVIVGALGLAFYLLRQILQCHVAQPFVTADRYRQAAACR